MRNTLWLLLVLAGTAAGAETAVQCASIDDAERRLACFDRIFGPAAPAPDGDPAPPAEGEGKGAGVFGLDEPVDLTTTVAAVRHRESQRMVFRLANGQIWMQVSPRYVRIREGDQVSIRNATMGGYLMRSSRDVTTRVQRIH